MLYHCTYKSELLTSNAKSHCHSLCELTTFERETLFNPQSGKNWSKTKVDSLEFRVSFFKVESVEFRVESQFNKFKG